MVIIILLCMVTPTALYVHKALLYIVTQNCCIWSLYCSMQSYSITLYGKIVLLSFKIISYSPGVLFYMANHTIVNGDISFLYMVTQHHCICSSSTAEYIVYMVTQYTWPHRIGFMVTQPCCIWSLNCSIWSHCSALFEFIAQLMIVDYCYIQCSL